MTKTMEKVKPGPKAPMEPIKSKLAIQKIKDLLKDNPRDYALFVIGINTAFRAGDLLNLTIGDVRYCEPGHSIGAHAAGIREGKTKNMRLVTIDGAAHAALTALLATMPNAADDTPIFQSLGGRHVLRGKALTVQTLQRKVAAWCKAVKLRGTYGSHTLRKTWAYQNRMKGAGVDLLQNALGHSSARITMSYACFQSEELRNLYSGDI